MSLHEHSSDRTGNRKEEKSSNEQVDPHDDPHFQELFGLMWQIDLARSEVVRAENNLSSRLLYLPHRLTEIMASMSHDEADAWLYKVYWNDRGLEFHIRRIYRQQFGCKYEAQPITVAFSCRRCGADVSLVCTSWTHYGRHENVIQCKKCQKLTDAEKNKARVAVDKRIADWRECKDAEIAALRAIPYREYLKSEHWQSVRLRALERANYRCSLCNAERSLDVHHRTYERLGEEYNSDVIAICRPCHEKHHNITPPSLGDEEAES